MLWTRIFSKQQPLKRNHRNSKQLFSESSEELNKMILMKFQTKELLYIKGKSTESTYFLLLPKYFKRFKIIIGKGFAGTSKRYFESWKNIPGNPVLLCWNNLEIDFLSRYRKRHSLPDPRCIEICIQSSLFPFFMESKNNSQHICDQHSTADCNRWDSFSIHSQCTCKRRMYFDIGTNRFKQIQSSIDSCSVQFMIENYFSLSSSELMNLLSWTISYLILNGGMGRRRRGVEKGIIKIH